MPKKTGDVTEIAQKQRHLSLLEKVREKRTLTKAEIRELKRFERGLTAPVQVETKRKRRPGRKKKPSRPGARLPITEADVRRLGLECESLPAAESEVKLPGRYSVKKSPRRLSAIFKEYPQLQEAWDRGRFLRDLKAVARTGASVPEAAKKLGFAHGRVLRTMIDEDPEVKDLWKQTRLEVYVEIKTALVGEAKDGNQAAIKTVEKFLLEEKEHPAFDPAHITLLQLKELTGKDPKTIYDWRTKAGLPRNADKTFDLGIVWAWHEGYLLKKITAEKAPVASRDPLREVRAEKLRVELAKHRNDLLVRSEVICSQIAWAQNVRGFLERGVGELARLCSNQPRERIAEIHRSFFRDLLAAVAKVPPELNLSAEQDRELNDFLKRVKPQ